MPAAAQRIENAYNNFYQGDGGQSWEPNKMHEGVAGETHFPPRVSDPAFLSMSRGLAQLLYADYYCCWAEQQLVSGPAAAPGLISAVDVGGEAETGVSSYIHRRGQPRSTAAIHHAAFSG